MASTEAIRFVENILQRADNQTRAILATEVGDTEVDSVNVMIGNGTSVITAGIAAALRVDFRTRITGIFLQEFDGTTGSVAITTERAQGGAAPTWVTMGSAAISSGRYFEDQDLGTWSSTYIARGDYLRWVVTSASTIMRVHLALRIRRLEP